MNNAARARTTKKAPVPHEDKRNSCFGLMHDCIELIY